jgi:hypothetical protein
VGIALCPECKIEPPVSGLSPKTAGGREGEFAGALDPWGGRRPTADLRLRDLAAPKQPFSGCAKLARTFDLIS